MTRKIKKLIKDFSISSFNYSGGMGGGEAGIDPPTTTKGDLSGYDTTFARIPVGVDATVLTADSSVPLGLAWEAAGGGIEYNQMTTVTTFSPTQQTGLAKVTVDRTDSSDTQGLVDVNVDGTVVSTLAPTEFYNSILNPATSLAITSRNVNYEVAGASYDSSYSFYAATGSPHGAAYWNSISISDDGTKFYVISQYLNYIYQFALSTPYDITTASYTQSGAMGGSRSHGTGFTFSNGGTKVYVTDYSNRVIDEYTLSTAWNIATISYVATLSSGSETSPQGCGMKPDGTKLYVVGNVLDSVQEYTLSTPYSISTATLTNTYLLTAQGINPTDVTFLPDGTKMYVLISSVLYQYSLSTAWDVSTATYDSVNFSYIPQSGSMTGMTFSTDGSRMYANSYYGVAYEYSSQSDYTGITRISIG